MVVLKWYSSTLDPATIRFEKKNGGYQHHRANFPVSGNEANSNSILYSYTMQSTNIGIVAYNSHYFKQPHTGKYVFEADSL